MNTIKRWGWPLLCALICAACGTKQVEPKHNGYSQFEQPDTANHVQRMKDYHYNATIEETAYHYDITRKADDSMPTVQNEEKAIFADNYICLKIEKSGAEFFHKTFTKQTFKAYLDPVFYKSSILDGIAFNKMENNNMRFVASIGYPDTDYFMLFSITIAPDGSYNISKEDNLEMNEE